jgi:hypothetical protein
LANQFFVQWRHQVQNQVNFFDFLLRRTLLDITPFVDPLYISARSAETILSDFRPLKLQTDALIFLNLFLDDILANIISCSRSILTDRLKTGLLKAIFTTIGKDALLEAEMELRAYWQRPNAIKPSPAQLSASEYNFSLPSMIEVPFCSSRIPIHLTCSSI